MSKHSMVCAGIDTGKRKLDVALDGSAYRLQVANTAEGHAELSAWLRRHRVKRVGIEASGGYEQAVVAQLRRAGFVVVVFQPAQVRAYAKFHLQRAKNDKIDAALIAACTAATKKIHAPPDPRLASLAEHQTLIDQIIDQISRSRTIASLAVIRICGSSGRRKSSDCAGFSASSSSNWSRRSASTAISPSGST